MKKVVLHRTHILKDYVKGYLTIEGSRFSCYTLEAKSIEGHRPFNPSLVYSLPVGTYPCKLGDYSMYPLVPFIVAKGYKHISFVKQENPHVRPGCIAVGTKFIGERFLDGFDEVYQALRDIITQEFDEWEVFMLEIVNDPSIVNVENGTYEETPPEEENDYNFVNL